MYRITEEHIDYILDDLRRGGVETEDLQLNLLDHICCLAEQNLAEGDDFEVFYRRTIPSFYRKELRELEEETRLLLTFKNYFMMKKIMIGGGLFAVTAFLFGAWFKIMHWPGANMLWLVTICLSAFVFIPLYCFAGIRKPETKTNTILTTIVLTGFTGLMFTMIRLRPSVKASKDQVYSYLQNEQIWSTLAPHTPGGKDPAGAILELAARLKAGIMEEAGYRLGSGTEDVLFWQQLNARELEQYFGTRGKGTRLLHQLQEAITQYNMQQPSGARLLDSPWLQASVAHLRQSGNLQLLNNLTQLQIYLGASRLHTADMALAVP